MFHHLLEDSWEEWQNNCIITVKQFHAQHEQINEYHLQDYRVAQAICNLLDNTQFCKCSRREKT